MDNNKLLNVILGSLIFLMELSFKKRMKALNGKKSMVVNGEVDITEV